ncbi:MAG: hypothetical protein J5997_13760 [Oscillospiraceae bacterium]|nr:hypothetical protein [Oscillospiraceae bacterium]
MRELTTSEIKSELNKAREAVRDYRLARDKANAYGQTLMGGKTVRYDSDGSTHERKGNPVENAYCTLADYETEVDELFREMVAARKSAEKYIRLVNDSKQRKVLIKYYLSRMDWDDIAYELGYSVRHVQRLHGYALIKISKST